MSKSFFFNISPLLIFAILLLNACGTPPIFDETPAIEWNRFTMDTIEQCFGSVSFIVDFTDGDGDLGTSEDGSDTSTNMYIIDTREGDTIEYIIPHIPQQGVANGISGEIEVDIGTIPCLNSPVLCTPNPGVYDSVVYRIQIRDRANRWSNIIETEPLYLRCFPE